jgi:acetyl esterase
MRLADRLIAMVLHATATWTVCYGDNLRFSGDDLPAPRRVRVPTRHGPVPVWVYRPSSPAWAAHVHFHGGAWLMRFPGMDDWWCRYLAATARVVVLNVDFHAGPYVTYPVAQHECHDVAEWAARGGGDLRLDRNRISVGGFSSGGGLAASVCLQARDAGTWRPALQVLGVPALDLATDPGATAEFGTLSVELRRLARRVYFPDPATRSHPYASPLLTPSVAGLPPAIVLTAERDVLRHDGVRYAERLREDGVPVVHDETPNADHYFLTEDPIRARATMAMVADTIADPR